MSGRPGVEGLKLTALQINPEIDVNEVLESCDEP